MFSNLDKLLNKLKNTKPRELNDHVLLLDSHNTFIRNFVTVKKVLPHNGQHVGGLVGFLRSLGLLSRVLRPTRVVCVFDGEGGSVNRKNLDPHYKESRQGKRLVLGTSFGSLAEEKESFRVQVERLQDYLRCLPVSVIKIDGFEADDVIALIARKLSEKGKSCTIVSTDEDYYQLIDDYVDVYNPISKKTYDIHNYQEKVIVHPTNYAVAKAIVGDKSDDIRGISGVGFKTLVKRLPQFKLPQKLTIDEVMQYCGDNMDAHDIYSKIVDSWDRIETNHKIIDLSYEWLSDREKAIIFEELREVPDINSQIFEMLLSKDRIEGFARNATSWTENFRHLTLYS